MASDQVFLPSPTLPLVSRGFAAAYPLMLPGILWMAFLMVSVPDSVQQVFIFWAFIVPVLAGAASAVGVGGHGLVGLTLERAFNHMRITLSFFLALFVIAVIALAIGTAAERAASGALEVLWMPAFVLVSYPFLRRAWPVLAISFVVPTSEGRRTWRHWLWSGPGILTAYGITRRDASPAARRDSWLALGALYAAVGSLVLLTNAAPGSPSQRPLAIVFYFVFLPFASFAGVYECARLWYGATQAPEDESREVAGRVEVRTATAETEDPAASPDRAYVTAAFSSDRASTKHYLSRGGDPDQRGELGAPAITLALRNGNQAAVRHLLRAGADVTLPDDLGALPVHYAGVHRGNLQFLKELLGRGAGFDDIDNEGATPLMYAARRPCPEGVAALLERGADATAVDVNGRSALHHAVAWLKASTRTGDDLRAVLAMVRRLVAAGAPLEEPDRHGRRPLHVAALWGTAAIVDLLLELGAERDALGRDGLSALQEAAVAAHREAAEVLLHAGAELDVFSAVCLNRGAEVRRFLDARPELARAKHPAIYEPLVELAVRHADLSVVRLILEHGVVEEGEPWRTSCLLEAVQRRRDPALAALLIEHGAPVNPSDGDGNVALAYAIGADDLELARLLLEAGGNPDIPNERGHTPRERARSAAMQALLKAAGGHDERPGGGAPGGA